MRPKSTHKDLPPRLLCRTRVLSKGVVRVRYYYNGRDEAGNRLEIFLSTDLNEAKRKWAELERQELRRAGWHAYRGFAGKKLSPDIGQLDL